MIGEITHMHHWVNLGGGCPSGVFVDTGGKRPAAFPGTRNQARHVARSDGESMVHQQY